MGTSGRLYVPDSILVGANKTDFYTQQGVGLASNGNITLTGPASDYGAGLFFARNGSSSYNSWIRQNGANWIEVSPHFQCDGELRSSNSGNAWTYAYNSARGNYIALLAEANGYHGLRSNGYCTLANDVYTFHAD